MILFGKAHPSAGQHNAWVHLSNTARHGSTNHFQLFSPPPSHIWNLFALNRHAHNNNIQCLTVTHKCSTNHKTAVIWLESSKKAADTHTDIYTTSSDSSSGENPLAEQQKTQHWTCNLLLYNGYVWIKKSNEMSFIYYSNFVSNYYLTRNLTVQNHFLCKDIVFLF